MTIKTFAKEAAFRIGCVVFPTVKPKQEEEPFDVEAHIARIQASFRDVVRDDLKPNV
jgi:hypothetical protein